MVALTRPTTACRLCGSKHLKTVIKLGDQALTGVFRKPTDPEVLTAPLELAICEDCRFLQLNNTVDSSLLYKEYWYRSGTNQTMRDHLAGVMSDVRAHVDLTSDDIVIDTGCNDGTLLNAYVGSGVTPKRIGVDPSDAIKDIKDPSITTINDFFTAENVREALGGRKAKVITSISMFYDLDDPNRFVQDVISVLDSSGAWVVEMNYTVDLIHNLGYDMIGHEHVAYYTLLTFERLLRRNNMFINDVSFNSINGGSIRLFCGFEDGETPAVAKARQAEIDAGYDDPATYANTFDRISELRDRLTAFIYSALSKGEKVAVYGASTRGNTILQFCGLTGKELFGAADRNPGKWGLQTAGSKVPIVSEEEVRVAKPAYMLALPYYFMDEFVDREWDYLSSGGQFIVPLPSPRLLSVKDNKLVETEI